jgi:hypothetical protein
MAKTIIEFSAATAVTESYNNYTSSKTILGPNIKVWTGSDASQYYISPPSVVFEDITQDTGVSDWGDLAVVPYTGSTYWLFAHRYYTNVNTNAVLAAYTYDTQTNAYTYRGQATFTSPIPSSTAWRGISADLEYYTTGSVQVNGTQVTGSGTDWIADRIPVGARIGFGSTSSADITTWHRIASYPRMTFKTGSNNTVYCAVVDNSGSIYIGGNFTSYSGSTANYITKLTPSGSIDTSFNTGVGFNSGVSVIRFDSSGSLYVGGTFTTYSGSTVNRIVKINPDGTRDTSFNMGAGFNSNVEDIQFDSTGSLYVGGAFTTYSGSGTTCITKLKTDGTKDATFITSSGTVNSTVRTIAVDNVDNIYIGGAFTQTGSLANSARYILKMYATGGVDTSFALGAAGTSNAFENQVYSILYKPTTNTIIVGGQFTTWKGVANTYLTELSATGTALISSKAISTVLGIIPYDSSSIFTSIGNNLISKHDITTLTVNPTFCPNLTYGTQAANGPRPIAVNPTSSTVYVVSNNTAQDGGIIAADAISGSHLPSFHTTPDYVSQNLILSSSAGTLPADTPYVIENLKLGIVQNSTNVFLIQGIALDDFTIANPTYAIPAFDYAALSKGCYGLLDTGYLTATGYQISNRTAGGAYDTILQLKQSEDTQYMFSRSSQGIGRYNIKNPQIRIHGGGAQGRIRFSTLNQFSYATNAQGANTRGTIATMNSGDASGSYSMYIANTGQFPLNELQNQTALTSQTMTEVPPGSATTYAASSPSHALYMPWIDRLILLSTTKSYITRFRTNLTIPTLSSTLYGRDTFNNYAVSNSFDIAFLANSNQLQGNTANAFAPRYPDTLGSTFTGAVGGPILHLCRPLTTIQNNIYAVPIGCEAQFVDTSNEVFITPKYTLPNVVAISGLYVNTLKQYGSAPFALPPEPIIIHYRTSGIDNNSGTWTEYTTIDALNDSLECDGVLESLDIQFRFSYKIAGNTCLPNRIYGFTLVYEDDRTDSHYTPSVAESSLTNRIFAWQQVEPWYGNIPELKIRLYNAANNKIVYYDTTVSSDSGTWEYSTDGVTWSPWNASADTVGNYIRYTADFIPSGIKLRVGLNRL